MGEMAGHSKKDILLVEDALPLARVYTEYLAKEPVTVRHAETGQQALDAVRSQTPNVIVLDLKLPDMDGLDVLRELRAKGVNCPAVVITAHGSINVAVEAMQAGAYDFVLKPFAAERLIVTLRNALEREELVQTVETIRETFDRNTYCGFIGSSLPMQAVYRIIDSAAPSKATVFITGESGTGKEICAEAIHRQSPRGDGPFIAVNCAAIPHDLMESEIFGHVKGAFTGASADRVGAASLAAGGTLFLDEVCEMDLALQAKLLRFVQTSQFQRVGSGKLESVDVRFVCATNRDPWREVEENRFREDLYFRLHVIPLYLPALRERGEDILEIANHFLLEFSAEEGKAFVGFGADVEDIMCAYDWPGNVRQLQNIIRNIVVLNDGTDVEASMLPPPLESSGTVPQPSSMTRREKERQGPQIRPMWEIERDAISAALVSCNGNVPRAAALLEISPSTVYRRIRDFGLE